MASSNHGIRRAEAHFDGTAGRRLFGRSWVAPAPVRTLVLVHGYAEHSGRYEHVGAWFAERGAEVEAYDHQGHGRSEGIRCHVRRFDDFLDDLDRVVTLARESAPTRPLYVIGHSMGGLIVSAWARERAPQVDGVVISSPSLSVPQETGARLRLLGLLRRVAPRFSIPSALDPEGLSRDPSVVQTYLADPLVHRRMTLSLAAELMGAIGRTAGGGEDVGLPLLMLHGNDDPICSPAASEAFARSVPDSRYRSYPGLRHEIFNEPEHETVFEDVQAWVEEREAGERSRAGSQTRRR